MDTFCYNNLSPTLLLIRSTVGIVVVGSIWFTYSNIQRWRLQRGSFTAMRLLSELRQPEGDRSQLSTIASILVPVDSLDDSWVFIAGDKDTASYDCIRQGDNFACRYSKDGKSFALYGLAQPPTRTMRELVLSHRGFHLTIEEDILYRVNWDVRIAECTQPCPDLKPGSYSLCYRNYVNHEECWGMMLARWGIEKFVMRSLRRTQLLIEKNDEAKLVENGIAFGILPINISWEGTVTKIEGATAIRWDTTSVTLGWKRFWSKVFDKPEVSEKIRVDPWMFYVSPGERENDIFTIQRKGKGRLVFAQDECIVR
jgi:hypothetical protein